MFSVRLTLIRQRGRGNPVDNLWKRRTALPRQHAPTARHPGLWVSGAAASATLSTIRRRKQVESRRARGSAAPEAPGVARRRDERALRRAAAVFRKKSACNDCRANYNEAEHMPQWEHGLYRR